MTKKSAVAETIKASVQMVNDNWRWHLRSVAETKSWRPLRTITPNDIAFTTEDIWFSYLPLAHIFERMVHVMIMYSGGRLAFYGGDLTKVIATSLCCGVEGEIGEDGNGEETWLFGSGVKLSKSIYKSNF